MWGSLDRLQVGMALCGLQSGVLAGDPGYAAILGRTPDQTRGLRMADVTHPDDRGCNDRLLTMLQATRAPFRITKRYLVGDAPVWVENRLSWLGGEGDDARLLLLCRRLHPLEIARTPLNAEDAIAAASAAAYIRDMAAQLAHLADQSRLPATASALHLAALLMVEEHEDLAGLSPA